MSYKSLLVHLDDTDRCTVRVALALDLAERFDAHLVGLYLPLSRVSGPDDARAAEQRRANAHASFLCAAERAARIVEWRAPEPADLSVATLHARHADLLVLGQHDPQNRLITVAANFVTDLLMTTARPAVIVPYAGAFASFGQNVLIAWDGSREAARAASDALPLLTHAQFVSLAVVTPPRSPDLARATSAAIDAAGWLERHGISASFHESVCEHHFEAGATLLSRASDVNADLLVAGAWAHSNLHERVLGGVTRTLLESMTLPVLMSH
ncbi:nucleotide-binding universal stress UspA family protein [Paraburkholderia bannensis]|uniref:Nucleotide-binding universal stress UspA family protein n=1 Tax=Paraburkholderia bannensis TaxID=765414 RepID=A0A7W9U4J8_9BURK|nr:MULTISPECIES: universal stress protein [Paraburkholderia]MBB3261898.1 nucleotide-binding universal stress UspA family protein [Paraburkholderia sp. WP4_3_2]MBB6106893.1 nucleotide-binding universal stress UspA family protein [Paraburkholderia bannensis]